MIDKDKDIDIECETFTYPWENQAFAQRLGFLKTKNKKTIVYIYGTADNSTFRYRVYNMCEILNKGSSHAATYFFINELSMLSEYLSYVDYLVIVRVPWTIELDKIIMNAHSKNIQLYFDVDDLIFDITKLPFVMNNLDIEMRDENYQLYFAYVSRLFLTASLCNAYITTNDFLSHKLQTLFNKISYIIPNFMNEQQMNISNKLWLIKSQYHHIKATHTTQKNILLGYFSGSPSHNNDFKSIASDLYAVMEKNHKIHLRLVGYLTLPSILQKFKNDGRIEYLPMQNYISLQKKIAECDINLVPLLVNEFTHCKSELKYFEAAIVGTISVASPTYIYKNIIKDGENGFLAQQGGWLEKIEKIIENFPNQSIVETARSHAIQNYYGDVIVKKLEDVYI